MFPLVLYPNAKLHKFIDHDKEGDLHFIATFLLSNVLTYIKVVPIQAYVG